MPRIQRKFTIALVAVIVAAFALSGWWADRALRARELANLESWLAAGARSAAELARDVPFDVAHQAELSDLARRASATSAMRITLIAPDGTVVADSEVTFEDLGSIANHGGRPEVDAALAGRIGSNTRQNETVGRGFHYLGVPRAPPSPPGVIRVAADLEPVNQTLAALRSALLTSCTLVVAATLLLSFLFSRSLAAPLRAIHAALAELSGGDLSARVRWRSGDELGGLARAVDRTAEGLQQSHLAIVDERDRLAAVLQVMVEGVLVVDAEERIVLANPRLRELLGVRGEIEGLRPLAAVRNADIDDVLREALHESQPVHREISLAGPERRVLGIHAASFAIGGATGAVAVFHDMTEVRRLETVRRDFVANASHEIKTPLTAIRGFAETLLSSELPARDARNYLEIILRHSERLSNLVEDLLELSRLESGKLKLEPGPLDVGALAAKLCRELEPRLLERGISVKIDCAGAPMAFADARAVEQILQNLLDNALKYSDRDREIELRVHTQGDHLRVDVADQGIGIPDADRARIFERFYRVDRGRSREQGGTGLGLSIVKHLVQTSGGDVWVESAPGVGSTFSFTLPLNFTRS